MPQVNRLAGIHNRSIKNHIQKNPALFSAGLSRAGVSPPLKTGREQEVRDMGNFGIKPVVGKTLDCSDTSTTRCQGKDYTTANVDVGHFPLRPVGQKHAIPQQWETAAWNAYEKGEFATPIFVPNKETTALVGSAMDRLGGDYPKISLAELRPLTWIAQIRSGLCRFLGWF